jgi:hypothetical protein
VFFRKATFWDGTGKDAPPAFHVNGVQYMHVKVGGWAVLAGQCWLDGWVAVILAGGRTASRAR